MSGKEILSLVMDTIGMVSIFFVAYVLLCI